MRLKNFLRTNQAFFIVIASMFVFRSAIADWNTVPTGSMLPTIVEGDRILVNKMAYDLRFPFTHIALLKISDPKRGDIVIFDSKIKDERLVKRVVGLPGDVVSMQNNVLTINGQQLAYTVGASRDNRTEMVEDLLGINHRIRVRGH